MTKSKTTKRALLLSVISMLLCLTMLVGSTFAWFTDSVTSGKNKIVAGNLDVELEYKPATVDPTTGEVTYGEWTAVGENTNLFMPTEGANATLWEPGHTEVVYLRVRNAGTLALKYQLSVSIYGNSEGTLPEREYTNVDNNKVRLSQHLVFNQINGATTVTNRSDLWLTGTAEANAKGNPAGLGKVDVLMPVGKGTSEQELTLAVYMPTSVGNVANQLTSDREANGAPTIFLGLNLVATQVEHEKDSFGDDYDKNAWLDQNAIHNDDGTYQDGNQIYVKDNNEYVPVTEDTATEGLYEAENGDKYVANAGAMTAAGAAGGNITALGDINALDSNPDNENKVHVNSGAIDLGGHTFYARTLQVIPDSVDGFTVENGKISATELSETSWGGINPVFMYLHTLPGTVDVALKNLTISSVGGNPNTYNVVQIDGIPNAGKVNVTIDNCNVSGPTYFNNSEVVISNSTFDSTGFGTSPLFDLVGETSLTITGGTYTTGNGELVNASRGSNTNVTVTITGGTFNVDPSEYVPETHQAVENEDGTWTVSAISIDETEVEDPWG